MLSKRVCFLSELWQHMKNPKLIVGLVLIALIVVVGWQIGSCVIANVEFHEDLRDMAAEGGPKIGFGNFSSDQELRDAVIRVAQKYDIELKPEQVTVRRTETPADVNKPTFPVIYLAADYQAPVKLPGFSFRLHFNPTSAR